MSYIMKLESNFTNMIVEVVPSSRQNLGFAFVYVHGTNIEHMEICKIFCELINVYKTICMMYLI